MFTNMHEMLLYTTCILYISCITYHGKTSIIFMLDIDNSSLTLKTLNKYFATFRIFPFSSPFMIHIKVLLMIVYIE